MKRILTLEVEIDWPEADWLWHAHIGNKPIHGVKVLSLSNGLLQDQAHLIESEEKKVFQEDQKCPHRSIRDYGTHEVCLNCGENIRRSGIY